MNSDSTVKSPLDKHIEALLFVMGQETTISRLVKVTKSKKPEVEKALDTLRAFYDEHATALAIVREGDKVQLVTSERVADVVNNFKKAELEGPLSRAAMETLSIIVYRGPITKPEIDAIRGVNSGIMLRTLLIRGLIDRKKSTKDARTFSYSVSLELLRHLGVSSREELPGFKDFSENKIIEKLAESVQAAEQKEEKKEAVADNAVEDSE